VDASANPYLALGAALAAGLDGVRRGLDLPAPVQVDPGNLSEGERQALRIEALPTNLGEALDALARDEVLLTALGPDLAKAYQAVRVAEWSALCGLELADEVALLLERY
jgi:glutamine synthetase